MIPMNDNQVRLCCNKRRGCPVVTAVDAEHVEIADDFGNKIKVKKDEAKLITAAVDHLDGRTLLTEHA